MKVKGTQSGLFVFSAIFTLVFSSQGDEGGTIRGLTIQAIQTKVDGRGDTPLSRCRKGFEYLSTISP
jgi:hypothetical protein